MPKTYLLIAVFALALLICPATARATSITVSLGNTSSGLTNGSTATTATVLAAITGQLPPFGAFCGSDAASNCDASWTFSYSVPSGETVTAGSLTLGIWDIDSKATGNQVALYQIAGGDVLTSAFNTAAEALNGNTGSVNTEYDVFTFALSNFAPLNSGSATVHLTLQGPGLGVLGNSTFNGAGLLFSTLNLTTTAANGGGGDGGGNPPPVPEPASLLLLGSGLAAGAARSRRAARR